MKARTVKILIVIGLVVGVLDALTEFVEGALWRYESRGWLRLLRYLERKVLA